MKTKYIISILLLVMGMSTIGQTVYTPWGTPVDVTEPNEGDIDGRLYWENLRRGQWPNAEYHTTWPVYPLYPYLSSTFKFNCHGYAWHMFWFGEDDELDEPVKMTLAEAENYFDDPSFMECAQSEADIWWINGGSHSAVATDNPAFLKSKWADGPLATHRIAESPYPPNMSYTTFYKKCSYKITNTYDTDITLNFCAIHLHNSSVLNYVDLEIEYEKGVLIDGTFSTGTGATLYFYPD